MSFLLIAVLSLPMFRQVVSVDCPDAASAKSLTAEATLLGPDEKYVLSARWDDRNPRSLPLAKALAPTGLRSTFYVCGSGPEFVPIMRELVALGNSIGCHTLSHDYMCRMLPVKIFREILQSRIELEVDSRSPVIAFGAPFGFGAFQTDAADFDNVKVVGEALRNAGLLGGTEGDGNSAAAFGLSTNEWVGSHVFFPNDRNPEEKRFWGGLAFCTNTLAKKMPGCGPHISIGLHPWQTDEGMAHLAEMVGKAVATPGVVLQNDNEYIARRLQFLHSSVRKVDAKGKRARFAVERPLPSAIGASVPLKLALSDGRLVDVPVPAERDLPKSFACEDGALSVSADDSTFMLCFTNRSDRPLDDVSLTLRLPPGYEPGVQRREVPSVGAGKAVTVVFKARVPTHPLFREGTLYAAVEINAQGRRIWAPLAKRRGTGEPIPYPRDMAVCLGPLLITNAPPDAAFAAMSRPGAPLTGDWHPADGSAEDDAAWAVTGYRRGEGPKVRKYAGWSVPPPGQEKCYALAFDFAVDTAKHGEMWKCVFTGGHVKPKNVRAWLNGEARANPAGELTPRDGDNRLVILLSDIDADMLRTILDIRSVRDGSPAVFKPLSTTGGRNINR